MNKRKRNRWPFCVSFAIICIWTRPMIVSTRNEQEQKREKYKLIFFFFCCSFWFLYKYIMYAKTQSMTSILMQTNIIYCSVYFVLRFLLFFFLFFSFRSSRVFNFASSNDRVRFQNNEYVRLFSSSFRSLLLFVYRFFFYFCRVKKKNEEKKK